MSVETQNQKTSGTAAPSSVASSLTAGQLPKFTWAGVMVVAMAVSAVILFLLNTFNIALMTVLGVVLFLVGMFALSASVEGVRRAKDRNAAHLIYGAFLLALIPLISVCWDAVSQGIARFDPNFFSYSMRGVVGEGGGAAHAIWGTLIVTGIATLIATPIGMLTAVYLVEYSGKGWLGRAITFFVDVMTGIPSIVAGLFAYTIVQSILGPGTKIGFAGAMALTILMIPTVVRATEEMLRIVPNELRESSYALGVPKFRTILKVVIPTSIGGIITGIILAIARIIGETAPLLVTCGINASMNVNAFNGWMATLPVFVYDQYSTAGGQQFYMDRAWAGALTLIIIVMSLNAIGRLIAAKFAPKPGR